MKSFYSNTPYGRLRDQKKEKKAEAEKKTKKVTPYKTIMANL